MNALEELGNHLKKANAAIKCATITHFQNYGETETTYSLPVNHTLDQFDAFCQQLQFDYDETCDPGLTGIIWYTDGSWLNRQGNNYRERWSYCSCPKIPASLLS
jgi:hypothetical protein